METTGKGVFRSCVAYDKDEAPADGCYKATDIPDDILSTLFYVTSIFSVDTIDGEACYCSSTGCYDDKPADNEARKGSNGAATMAANYSLLNVLTLTSSLLLCISIM